MKTHNSNLIGSDAAYQVTHWMHPDDTIEVIFAATLMKIPVRAWLGLEIERWASANDREAWVEESDEGLVALFSRREYQQPVDGEE